MVPAGAAIFLGPTGWKPALCIQQAKPPEQVVALHPQAKAAYNDSHRFTSWLAIAAFLVLRNATPALRRFSLPLLGAFAYATYDLTNQATLAVWPVHVSLADIAWGTFASATASPSPRAT